MASSGSLERSLRSKTTQPIASVYIGALGFGVAAQDDYSGTGYLLYTSESVFTRFASSPPHPSNATNLIAVRLVGTQWQYDNNDAWVNFTTVASDRLLASIDFTADTITSFEGTSGVVAGVASGYSSGDLVFTGNQWNGGTNDGEFGITGTFFEVGVTQSPGTDIGALGFGVAAQDDYSGTGYLLYSSESVFTRFASSPPHASNATNLIAVRLEGTQWQYDNNDAWVNFTPVSGDRLLASIDFTADTITSLEGTSGAVAGINSGYASGDLVFTGNQWNGGTNDGEFGITGTFFEIETPSNGNIGALGFGVAAQDDYSGTGYLLYSSESVFTRFASSLPHPSNATNLIAVRLEGTQWQYDNNLEWVNFTPVASDRLLASIDFTADTITSLEGTSGVVAGIDSGYASGDLVFTANQWNGATNDGEFGITGTFFA